MSAASRRTKRTAPALKDAKNLAELAACDVLITCHGGEYTKEVYAPLRKSGWKGYWIDASSTLRMSDDAVIILDPVNSEVIQEGLRRGLRNFAGGNCTTSLMLMAVNGLFKAGLIEWITTMTYQAASGAGAANMLELVEQMECLTNPTRENSVRERARSGSHDDRGPAGSRAPDAEVRRASRRQPDPLDRGTCPAARPRKSGRAWLKPTRF